MLSVAVHVTVGLTLRCCYLVSRGARWLLPTTFCLWYKFAHWVSAQSISVAGMQRENWKWNQTLSLRRPVSWQAGHNGLDWQCLFRNIINKKKTLVHCTCGLQGEKMTQHQARLLISYLTKDVFLLLLLLWKLMVSGKPKDKLEDKPYFKLDLRCLFVSPLLPNKWVVFLSPWIKRGAPHVL